MHILLRLPINVYKLIMQTKASYPPKNGRKKKPYWSRPARTFSGYWRTIYFGREGVAEGH